MGDEVICICAEWCGVCREYRPGFEALSAEFSGTRFRWLDTEDDAGEIGEVEVENFPTIVVRRDGRTLFCGAQPPSREVLRRLLESLLRER